ncbi:MAG: S8 family peptidase [Chitinophagaceae bacterium]|nr:S8 family peptidase [Chitinophagaceae bacterium]
MKHCIIYFMGMLSLLFSNNLFSQNIEEKIKLNQQVNVNALNKIKTDADKRLQRMNEIKSEKNWEEYKIGQDGKSYFLFDITENEEPIYVTSLDSGSVRTANANPLYIGGSLGINIEGQGMVAGVWEVGTAANNEHPLPTHSSFITNSLSRVMNMDSVNTALPYAGHSTSVCGVLLADKTIMNGRPKGIAPQASAYAFNLTNMQSELNMMLQAPYNLLVSNHSYGQASFNNSYNSSYFDSYTINAPNHLFVIANGNSWLNYFSGSKNSISVGMCNQVINYTGPASVSHPGDNNPALIFQTPDFRIKPDLVAKSQNVYAPNANGINSYSGSISGTSFAAPVVTGGVLLLQQLYKDYHPDFMRSSTVKALMLHTTREAGTIGPDLKYGFGLLNLEGAANVIINDGLSTTILEETLLNNTTFVKEVDAASNQALEATISWLDPVNVNVNGIHLINDLDIRVTSASGIELPWGLDTLNPLGAAIKLDNIRDNVEKIQIMNPVPNQTYTITVSHKGTLQGGEQKFSLIISGISSCNTNPNIIITAPVNINQTVSEFASQQVIASNTIAAYSSAKYYSENEVLLTNNFNGLANSTFDAVIEGCNIANKYPEYNPINRNVLVFEQNENNIKAIEQKLIHEPKIFPNPSNGMFTIDLNGLEYADYEVRNTQGQVIQKGTMDKLVNNEINLSANSNGIYFLIMNSNEGIVTQKLIKQ